ncbi:MAG TPA: glycosyl hydrolase 53 family protein, partial [Bacteroidales bacterium]|nr:glycosyl hydrolase 53 family protein [Bacteroidales bacterium]
MKQFLFISLLVLALPDSFAQKFYRGNDLSYANEMEDCGAVFKENMQPKDVFQIFADHGTNLVRVRLWYKPSWQKSLDQPAGVKNEYSNMTDVEKTIRRAKETGMEVMLGLHLSDFWADPAKQHIPDPWVPVATDLTTLKDSVYNYVTRVLTTLNNEGLMPEIVKVGNETNSGILKQTTLNSDYTVSGTVSSSWSRHAQLFNAAIKAVRDISEQSTIKPKIALHCAGLNVPEWWYDNIISNGVTDFDIMGFSYYYAWHGGSIQKLGEMIRKLKAAHPQYAPMVVEPGYLWTTENFDQMPNIINVPDPAYLPVIPEKQLEYMTDYTREVKKAGGMGVIFWEPDWVSTPCRTPWGTGSSQEHVAFFDPVNTNFMENGGGRWTEPQFYEDLNTVKVTFKVNMTGQDVSKGVFLAADFAGDSLLPMAD